MWIKRKYNNKYFIFNNKNKNMILILTNNYSEKILYGIKEFDKILI